MEDYRRSHADAGRGEMYDQRYADQAGSENYYWRTFERPLLEELFARLSVEYGGPYLDFATGTGRILEVAATQFSDVTGVDISEHMLSQARRKVPSAKLIQCDVTQDAWESGKFKVVSSFRFILNAQPELRAAALKWIRAITEDGGVLVVNNHLNRWSLTGMVCQLSNLLRREKRHQVMSDGEATQLLARSGFSVVEIHGFSVLPAWRNRLLLPAKWITVLEKVAVRFPPLRKLSKDRVYVCRPARLSA